MKRLILAVAVGLLVTVSAASFAQEKTKLVVMDWKLNEAGKTQEWFAHVKAAFEQKFPNVEIEYLAKPFGDPYLDQILVGAAGGVSPDVVSLSVIWARDLWDKGYLLDLTPYVNRTPELQPDRFIPATQLYNQKDGRIYGITNELGASLIAYDLDAFEQAGLDTDPNAIATWDDFLAIAKSLMRTEGNEVTRWAIEMPIFAEGFSSWLTSNGGSFYNGDLTQAGFNSEKGIQTAEFLQELSLAGVMGGRLRSYTAAMAYSNNALPDYLATRAPDMRFNLASFPAGPSSTSRGSTVWGNMSSIPASTTKADLAWEFIKLYNGLEASMARFVITGNGIIPRLDFYQSDVWRDALDRYVWAPQIPEIAMVGGVFPFLRHTDLTRNIFDPIMAPALRGETGIAGAFSEAERLYNAILAGR